MTNQLGPSDERVADPDVEALEDQSTTVVPDDDRAVPEDFNELVPAEEDGS